MQVGLIQTPYLYLVDVLANSAVLPEYVWDTLSAEEQAEFLEQRAATAEPLLEALGELTVCLTYISSM